MKRLFKWLFRKPNKSVSQEQEIVNDIISKWPPPEPPSKAGKHWVPDDHTMVYGIDMETGPYLTEYREGESMLCEVFRTKKDAENEIIERVKRYRESPPLIYFDKGCNSCRFNNYDGTGVNTCAKCSWYSLWEYNGK